MVAKSLSIDGRTEGGRLQMLNLTVGTDADSDHQGSESRGMAARRQGYGRVALSMPWASAATASSTSSRCG